ncbi:hypothetical protein ABIA33_001492 [Streptacidiphilus sp. MAP12-16]
MTVSRGRWPKIDQDSAIEDVGERLADAGLA